MRAIVFAVLVACGGPRQPAPAPANHAEPPKPLEPWHSRDEELDIARRDAAEAQKQAQELEEKFDRLAKDVADLDQRVTAAIDAVTAAQMDADRAAAKAKLEQLRKEQQEMEARIRAAKDAAAKARRKQGQKVSKECMDNPLAKGCS